MIDPLEPIEVMVDVDGNGPENMYDLVAEAYRRRDIDGIPRYVTFEGKIMKKDWELTSDADLDSDLADHIRRMTEGKE